MKKVSYLKKTTSGPFLYYLWQCSQILFPVYIRFKTKTRGPAEEIDFGPFYIAYGNAGKSYFQSIAEDVKKGELPQKNDFGSLPLLLVIMQLNRISNLC